MEKVGIIVIATNAYLPLGIRLIKKFNTFYTGQQKVHFYLLTDHNPSQYMRELNVSWIERHHTKWTDGTDTKFEELVNLANEPVDYLYVLDADTNIDKPFDLDWLLGETAVCEHFGNRTWMADNDKKNYDRNPKCRAYVPRDTPLPQMYYMGMLFGGKRDKAVEFCRTLKEWRDLDKAEGHPACVQDESYVNKYFHVNPPGKVVPIDKFPWVISDKGGIPDTRQCGRNIDNLKRDMTTHIDSLFEIRNGAVIVT